MTATATPTTTATPVIGDARFKAVRRVKNRFKAQANREIGRYTRAIAASKDKNKIAVNQARVEAWQKAVALLDEV